jgi:hypothetical protein
MPRNNGPIGAVNDSNALTPLVCYVEKTVRMSDLTQYDRILLFRGMNRVISS